MALTDAHDRGRHLKLIGPEAAADAIRHRFGGGQPGLGVIATAIALRALKYAEQVLMTGPRGTAAVTFSGAGANEQTPHAMRSAHSSVLRSREVALAADGTARIVCHGCYRGRCPQWSSDLVETVSAPPEVARVECSDADERCFVGTLVMASRQSNLVRIVHDWFARHVTEVASVLRVSQSHLAGRDDVRRCTPRKIGRRPRTGFPCPTAALHRGSRP